MNHNTNMVLWFDGIVITQIYTSNLPGKKNNDAIPNKEAKWIFAQRIMI